MNTTNVLPFRQADKISKNDFQTIKTSPDSLKKPKLDEPRRRVLIVEFRDEFFASIKPVLEDLNWEVKRVSFAGSVVRQVQRFKPDLILLNEHTTDGSGWLISCKLLLALCFQPIWIYSSKNQPPRNEWKEYCGVEAVILYDGILSRLVENLRQQLVDSEKIDSKSDQPGYDRQVNWRRKLWTKRA